MEPVIRVVVSGANGQLGREFESLLIGQSQYEARFLDKNKLDILDQKALDELFKSFQPDVFINCAAYTKVDLAEEEVELCRSINSDAVDRLARLCAVHKTLLVHFSTDYVFNGQGTSPYRENDATDPINAYGQSKLVGEQHITKWKGPHCVIRSSWLYSSTGHNFVKTMLKLGAAMDELRVVNDQVGSPTWTKDLANDVLQIVRHFVQDREAFPSGVYHYTQNGLCSWYDFALAIFDAKGVSVQVEPVSSDEYVTRAERPKYSKLNTEKITETFGLQLRHWQDALTDCLKEIE